MIFWGAGYDGGSSLFKILDDHSLDTTALSARSSSTGVVYRPRSRMNLYAISAKRSSEPGEPNEATKR
jgi:hypothetical protein